MKKKSIVQSYAVCVLGLLFFVSGLSSCKDEQSIQKTDQSVTSQTTKEKRLQLSPGYLKEIPDSSGVVFFQDNSKGVFVGRIELSGLTKGSYLLTLNENNQFPIDKKFSGWREWGSEKFLDFEQVYVDATGSYKGDIEVELPPGKYTFKFFVKEVGGTYPSVLYNNFLKLKVK